MHASSASEARPRPSPQSTVVAYHQGAQNTCSLACEPDHTFEVHYQELNSSKSEDKIREIVKHSKCLLGKTQSAVECR